MTRGWRGVLSAAATLALFPALLFAIGLPFGLALASVGDASTAAFWLSVVPPAAAVLITHAILSRIPQVYDPRGPVIVFVLIGCGAGVLSLMSAAYLEAMLFKLLWCAVVLGAVWVSFGRDLRDFDALSSRGP